MLLHLPEAMLARRIQLLNSMAPKPYANDEGPEATIKNLCESLAPFTCANFTSGATLYPPMGMKRDISV